MSSYIMFKTFLMFLLSHIVKFSWHVMTKITCIDFKLVLLFVFGLDSFDKIF